MSTPKYWPSMSDYQEAVQAPKLCFTDGNLASAAPVMNKLGLPRPICGQFASVYELEQGGHRWGVKCFLRNIPDQHSRYAKISAHIGKQSHPYFMVFEYQQKGIRVRGQLFPIVKMDWIEGLALNNFIENNLSNKTALEELEARWVTLLEDLQSVQIAHGDLQHGNVLVADDGTLRLIDYDGMWVPKLKGQQSHETGHPNFQSPLRTGKDFDLSIDQFAGELIQIAIRAVGQKPDLWKKYNNGDNLLFKQQDFMDTNGSTLFGDLRALGDPEIDGRLDGLIAACGGKARRGASRFFKPKRAKKAAPPSDPAASGGWKKPAAPPPPKAKPQPVAAPRAAAPAKAPPPRPAPQKAAPLRGGLQPSGGSSASWLSDHVVPSGVPAPASVTARIKAAPAHKTPAAGPAAAPAPVASKVVKAPRAPKGPKPPLGKRVAGYFRLATHVLLIAPVLTVAIRYLVALLGDEADRAIALLLAGLGTAAVMGLLSIMSLFIGRAMHTVVSSFFFGLTGLFTTLSIASVFMTFGWSAWVGDEPLDCVFTVAMLGLSVLGLLAELACRRLGIVAHWRAL